jgi:restriction endonuclease S subunit
MSHYKPYPEYRPSGVEWIGDVPSNWEVKRLRQVASFTNSGIDKKSYEDQEQVSLCNYTDVYYEASQINLNLEIISKIKVPVPPYAQQLSIAKLLVHQLGKLDAIETKALRTIDLLKERRSAFITAAVTGQIDLRESA